MLVLIINLLIWLLLLGLCFYLVIWVLGILGIAVPLKVMQIVGAIIALIVILYFVQAIMGSGGHFPRFLMIPLMRVL